MQKFLKYTLVAGVFVIPFIPFIVSYSLFFPFITGKNFSFRILIEILLGLWVILALLEKNYRPRFSWILASVVAFLAVIGLADFFSANPYKSFWSNFERMEGYITLLHLGAYFLILSSVLNTGKMWRYFWNTSLGASALMSGYGLLQLFGLININQSNTRLDATMGNAIYFAVYLLFHIFIALFLLFRSKGKPYLQTAYGVLIFVETCLIFYTETRGVALGLIGGLFIWALLTALFEKGWPTSRKISAGVIIGIIVIVSGFISAKNQPFVKNSRVLGRFAAISLNDTKTQARSFIWPMAIQGFKERPILGWGQESFNYVFNTHYNPQMFAHEQWFDRTHNIILDWLIQGGILGLLSYLSILVATLCLIWKRKDNILSLSDKSIFTGLLAGYFFQNLFAFDNITSYALFFSVLAFVHYMQSSENRESFVQKFVMNRETVLGAVVPTVIVLTLIVFYFVNFKPLRANQTLISALSEQKDLPKSMDYFKQALSYNSFGTEEIGNQIFTYSLAVAGSNASQDMKNTFGIFGKETLTNQTKYAPNDARGFLFLGSYLNRFGQYAEAQKVLERALELSPSKQGILFELGNSLASQKKYDEAIAVFKTAYELDKNYADAGSAYVSVAIVGKRMDIVESVLSEMEKSNVANREHLFLYDTRIINAYITIEDWPQVAKMFKARIEKNPEISQNRISLAATYLKLGRRSDAIKALEDLIGVDPSFKAQGDYFISEIKAGRNP